MAHLSSGTFKFTQRLNTGDYQHKEASAELTFAGDNEDTADQIADLINVIRRSVVDQAHKMLGKPEDVPSPVAEPIQPDPAPTSSVHSDIIPEPKSDTIPEPKKPRQPRKSHNSPEVTPAQEAVGTLAPGPNLFEPVIVEISTEDLMKEITKHHSTMMDRQDENPVPASVLVRNLISKYVTAPQTARDIPQEHRPAFLAALAALYLVAHSPLGASSASRFLKCPGSPRLVASLGVNPSEDPLEHEEWTRAGTAAHDLGADCLVKGDVDAWELARMS